jgi:hypothetical protein
MLKNSKERKKKHVLLDHNYWEDERAKVEAKIIEVDRVLALNTTHPESRKLLESHRATLVEDLRKCEHWLSSLNLGDGGPFYQTAVPESMKSEKFTVNRIGVSIDG